MRILLIDDDPLARQGLRDQLRHRGYDVQTASEGREALAVVDRYDPEWILVDLYVSGVDGLETIRTLRSRRSRARIIAMAEPWRPCVIHCLQAARAFGANALAVKPVEVDQIVDVLRDDPPDRGSWMTPAVG